MNIGFHSAGAGPAFGYMLTLGVANLFSVSDARAMAVLCKAVFLITLSGNKRLGSIFNVQQLSPTKYYL